MKKTLIALALMTIAGTAAAKSVEVQADVYSGKEFVKTYKAVVPDGASTEIKDKEVAAHFGSKPAPSAEARTSTGDPRPDEQNPELGLSLKMTPHVLPDGQILMDAAYSLTTEGTSKVLRDGVENEEPVTRFKSTTTSFLVNKEAVKQPDSFTPHLGDLIISFSAKEVL